MPASWLVLLTAALLSLMAQSPAPPLECAPETKTSLRYTVLMMGNHAGSALTCLAGSDTREVLLEYTDRGRGPRTRTKYRMVSGLPTEVDTTGHDYYKNAIAERFVIHGSHASWKNRVEEGERFDAAGRFYLGFSSPRFELALLVRALLSAPNHRLPLLPEGEAWLEQGREHSVASAGRTRQLTHYTIKGLGFLREHVWLDTDGEFFASPSAWVSIALEGWEGVIPELKALQDRVDADRSAEIARTLPKRPAQPVALTNARLFDAERAAVVPGMTVVIDGDRIVAVGADGATPLPKGAAVRDLGGATLLPGLWDMHVHINELGGLLNIAAGVTSVRDLANDPDTLADLRRRFDDGSAVGPHVVAAGIIDGPGPYQGPTKMLVSTAADARKAVDAYAERGYRHVKLYSSLDPALVPAIVARARELGLRVSGHVPAFMTAEQAVRAGYDEIQHMNMLFLNFWPDVTNTQTPARFTEVAARAGDLDLTSEEVRRFVDLLRERQIVVDPTLSIFEGMFTDRPGQMAAAYVPVADRIPAYIRRSFLDGGLPHPPERDAQYRRSFDAMLKMLKLLHDRGVTIVAGTDALAGYTLHHELELYVQAGLPAASVLQMATLGAARVAHMADRTGSILTGKRADLLVVDGDPSKVIADIRRTRLVVKSGVFFEREAIDETLTIKSLNRQ